MKAKEAEKVGVLRMLKAALMNAGIEAKKEELTDEEVIAVLNKEAKKRKESEEAFAAAGRDELAGQERNERAIIEQYLPPQMSQEEIRTVVREVVSGMEGAAFGAVMGAAMQQLKGKADGEVVKTIVQEIVQT